jgi:hypothetical protein
LENRKEFSVTNREAFNKLREDRPVIVALLQRDVNKFRSAEQLAESIIAKDDSAELIELIQKAAKYICQTSSRITK